MHTCRYNFVSRLKFIVQFYCLSALLCQISLKLSVHRRKLAGSFKTLLNSAQKLKRMGLKPRIHNERLQILYTVAVLFFFTILVLDIRGGLRDYSSYMWICLYVPGISVSIYALNMISVYNTCRQLLDAINQFLAEHCDVHEPRGAGEIFERPIEEGGFTLLEELMVQHDEICESARTINDASGMELTLFFLYSYTSALSEVYDFWLDALKATPVVETVRITAYVTEFFGVAFLLCTVIMVEVCSRLSEGANRTRELLHSLVNVHPILTGYVSFTRQVSVPRPTSLHSMSVCRSNTLRKHSKDGRNR